MIVFVQGGRNNLIEPEEMETHLKRKGPQASKSAKVSSGKS